MATSASTTASGSSALVGFFRDGLRSMLHGSRRYKLWMAGLGVVALVGVIAYIDQTARGLIVSGMSDQVPWGLYIANFSFLFGVAAAAVLVVVPAYVFDNRAARHAVLMAEGVAVAAGVMCMLFVTVDLGRPDRAWHMMPIIGRLNWPVSPMSWDVVILMGYMALSLLIPMYILYRHYRGRQPDPKRFLPFVYLMIVWSIVMLTAFLYSWNAARPFWHSALLGPRYVAAAFSAGPGFLILAFQAINTRTAFRVDRKVISMLAIAMTVALQINLFMLAVELYAEFFRPTEHGASAHYLFFGLHGHSGMVPWIWSSIAMQVVAVVVLMVHSLRRDLRWLDFAAVLTIIAIWIEKGIAFIVPGFVPTPIGEIFEYTPSLHEALVTAGIWAIGLAVFTALVKAAVPIELGLVRHGGGRGDGA